jgi:hypothetical protein
LEAHHLQRKDEPLKAKATTQSPQSPLANQQPVILSEVEGLRKSILTKTDQHFSTVMPFFLVIVLLDIYIRLRVAAYMQE